MMAGSPGDFEFLSYAKLLDFLRVFLYLAHGVQLVSRTITIRLKHYIINPSTLVVYKNILRL